MAKYKSPLDAIVGLTEATTKTWTKQRKAEERSANAASHRYVRLVSSNHTTLRDAAFNVMEEAYLAASDNGKLPVKARQIMYCARPAILEATKADSLDDAYFTQTLLPDYMEEYDCDDWDVVWDARGTFHEPHTGYAVPIGTLQVRQYLGERPEFDADHGEAEVDVADNSRFPTKGPENRYKIVFFVEKEGFDPLLKATRVAERFDVAVMSTKGMSTTAARMLLDSLAERGVEKVLVLRDFDVSGFSIFGTLGTNGRRYRFRNKVPIIDLGLRLSDVKAMSLESEPVVFKKVESKIRKAATLRRHGATAEEVVFLMRPELGSLSKEGRRVELNAMTSRQFIDFIEQKFKEHGIEKVIPDDAVMIQHARRVIEGMLAEEAIEEIKERIAKEAAETKLPEHLRRLVEQEILDNPALPWDLAVAHIVGRLDLDQKDDETEGDSP